MATNDTTVDGTGAKNQLVEQFDEFLGRYYEDEIAVLAQQYPKDSRSLRVSYADLARYDIDLADDWLDQPGQLREWAEAALRQYELPVDVGFSRAHVRLTDLDDADTFFPGEFSPTNRIGEYVGIEGQVGRTSGVYMTLLEAAFECQRCGTMSYVPQDGTDYQSPHECQGCEREGPFEIDYDQSEYIDGQKLRIEEPPERTGTGTGAHIDVFVEDDLVRSCEPGDKVTVSGIVRLEQLEQGSQKQNRFEPFVDAEAVTLRDTQFEDIEITPEEREEIRDLADPEGEETIFDLAEQSIAPGITGERYDAIKRAIFLQLVSGVRGEGDGVADRGDIHQLLLGDPSTGKSHLQDAAREIAPRAVKASGKGASKAGMTAAATRDGFADENQWTLEAGAMVKATGGLACLDELDKMDAEVAESIHTAMEQQEVAVNKAGINTTLPSRTAVLGAANPKYGRWDPHDPIGEQITLGATLMSRFALVWKLEDRPDPDADAVAARRMIERKEAAKGDPEAQGAVEPAIDTDLFQKYIAYARREIEPRIADEEVRESLQEWFHDLRGMYGYDNNDAPVPVSKRKLPDLVRLAEAAARAELSETVEQRHVEVAQHLMGESLAQLGMNEEGEFDADMVETGTSSRITQITKVVEQIIEEEQSKGDRPNVGFETVADEAREQIDADEETVERAIGELMDQGEIYRPDTDRYRST